MKQLTPITLNLQDMGGCLEGGVSDCEELVGEVNHTTECVTDLAKRISNCINYGFIVLLHSHTFW